MNLARHDLAACYTRNSTYAVGGLSRSIGSSAGPKPMKSLEKYSNGSWSVIPLELPFSPYEFYNDLSVVALKEETLLILGGWEEGIEIIKYNVEQRKVKFIKTMEKFSKIPWNMWVKEEKKLTGYDDEGEIFSLDFSI